MKCDFPVELLSGYIDSELDQKNKALVEDHLRSCPACRQVMESMKRHDVLLRSRDMEEPSREFVFSLNRRVMDRIRGKPKFSVWRYLPGLVPVAVAAAVLVVVFGSRAESGNVTVDDRILLPATRLAEYYDETGLRGGAERTVIAKSKASAPKKEREKAVKTEVAGRDEQPAEPPAGRRELAREIEDVELGPLVACESKKDDDLDKAGDGLMAAGKAGEPEPCTVAQIDVPKNQVVRAIVDSTGRILRVATGNTIVPESDTMLEKQLEGQQMAPPTVRSKRNQVYVDLSAPSASASSDSAR